MSVVNTGAIGSTTWEVDDLVWATQALSLDGRVASDCLMDPGVGKIRWRG
jgi:hypothetical protein